MVCAKEQRRKAAKRTAGSGSSGIISARSAGTARSASRTAASSVRRTNVAAARGASGGRAVRVKQATRHAGDGWSNELLPGLRSSLEARDLLTELARAEARLERLRNDPPGPYATVRALAGGDDRDREEAAWLLFQIAYYGPVEGDDPFAPLTPLLVRWDAPLPDDAALGAVAVGPRGAHAHDRGTATLAAYREWAQRAGGQLAGLAPGGASSDPARRFDAAYRALALPGLSRAARFEFVLTLGTFGILDVAPWSLLLDGARDGRDPLAVAAKRAFLTGDSVLLQRRLGAFARALGTSIAACDLGFLNWELRPGPGVPLGRLDAGVPADPDPQRVTRFAAALGLVDDAEDEPGADASDDDA